MTVVTSSSSPSVSPPSLLQSSFSSSTDTHNTEPPPTPCTPPRGRSRYPSHLAHDGLRVPLHRRGTSKTYERLEDLLKEAGYKETRIFTPETERHREQEQDHGAARQTDGKLRNGVDTVVGFLAGLVLGQVDAPPTDFRAPRNDRGGQDPLVSPSTHQHKAALHITSTARASPSSSRTRAAQGRPLTSRGLPDKGHPQNDHASPARAYLRHIASAPNIPQRRLLGAHGPTPVTKRSTTSLKDDHRIQSSPPPPMPSSWLETVARAVLGFPGARMGGPNCRPSHSPSPLPAGQSKFGRSSLPTSRSGTVHRHGRSNQKKNSPLEDVTVRLRGHSTASLPTSSDPLQPPMRSSASPGQVVKINVVCRSAPASRSSSVVGRRPGSDSLASASLGSLSKGSVRGKGKTSQSESRKYRPHNPGHLTDSGPSLCDRVEDGLTLHSHGNRHDYDSSSEDEDEGEVDLSKLLVHTRRQQTIKSLRRHLERPPGKGNPFDVSGTWTLRGGDDLAIESDGGGRLRRGSVNEGDWGLLVSPGPVRDSRSFRRRRGIPVSWTQTQQSDRSRR